MEGWICPKCSRVWGPFVMACQPCNSTELVSASDTVTLSPSQCPACLQDRTAPPLTGCPTGSHWGTFCDSGAVRRDT